MIKIKIPSLLLVLLLQLQDDHKTITRQNKTLVVQDMDLKNPVLAVVPRDNQKTITRVSVVRVRVRVTVWVRVKVLCLD
jgi:hypothetical protein